MVTEIIIVRIYDGDDTTYEIRNQNNTMLYDADSLESAYEDAMELAAEHDVEFIKIQVATESA